MSGVHPQSPAQFAVFRWLFGLYLAAHMAHLVPWGPELFSHRGVLPDPAASPLAGLFPNLLAVADGPLAVRLFLAALAAAALIFAAGRARPVMALVLWYGWTCLFLRNPLIANPGLPYVGLILVLSALVPAGEGLALGPGRAAAREGWAMPLWVWRAAFVALMAGYSYSGLVKLGSPSWVNGEALEMLLVNPLARDIWLREALVALPQPLLRATTWLVLAGEILALPLCLLRRGRALAWAWMLGMHLAIVLVVDFADLTLGMVMAHLFVFDPRWLPADTDGRRRVVFFDGVCALCDGTVRFLIREDSERLLRFAPLQGATAAAVAELGEIRGGPDADPTSIVYLRGEGETAELLERSAAILAILDDLGGIWRLAALGRVVPRPLRDRLYELVARHRYRWFGRFESCRLPRPGEAERFLD